MASCDAFYRFLYVDAGTTGRWSDGGTYDQCSLAHALDAGTLHVPYHVLRPFDMSLYVYNNIHMMVKVRFCCRHRYIFTTHHGR